MNRPHNEYHRVELPFVEQLKHMGWQHIEGDVDVPEFTERTSFRESDVLLQERLAKALRRINIDAQGNTWLTDQHVRQAISDLERVSGAGLLEANEHAMDLLLRGTLVEGDEALHSGKNATVHYIDYNNPLNNDFLAINQFRVNPYGVQGNKGYIIPDIMLFVNGIPLVVVECKSPYLDESATPMETGINDLLFYSNQHDDLDENSGAVRLFHTNLITVSTYFDEARFGTITSRHKHYLEWKDTYPLTEAELAEALGLPVEHLSSQHRLVAGMLRPENLIDILANFMLFKTDGGKRVKIVARYQQFRAVQNAVYRLEHGQSRLQHGKDDQRGGIIWHTQGSGKSLTMVFLIRKMRRNDTLRKFKVVVVTDRTDLQDQLSETAALSGATVHIARSSSHLRELLQQRTPDLIFAMIQKYREAEGIAENDNELFPELNDSENILVMVDEAHRSHASALHANLRRALRNAANIGFTGTPIIMGKRKETTKIFGPFVDVYTIDQSVEDGYLFRG
jgi:type I restriction enzyme, R subunit